MSSAGLSRATVAAGGDVLPQAAWAVLSDDLVLLGLLHGQELTAEVLDRLRREAPECWFALQPGGDDVQHGIALVQEGFDTMPDPADAASLDDLAAEYAAIYLTFAYHAAPTESVWRDKDGLERQTPMFVVRECYARYGLEVADWRRRSDDHLVHELAYLATLLREGSAAALADAATFLRDHLLVWFPAFAGRVSHRCHLPFYAGLQMVTVGYLRGLSALLEDATQIDMTPPEDEVVAAAIGATGQGRPIRGVARTR